MKLSVKKIHEAHSTVETGKRTVFTGLFNPTCTRVHRKKFTFDWLRTVLHRSCTCSYSGILTFSFSTGITLNYFMQGFTRRSCQRSPPNPAYTRATRGRRWPAAMRGPRNQTPIPSLTLGERRLSPCPGRCQPAAQTPFCPPALWGASLLLRCADVPRSQTGKSLPAVFQLIRNQAANHRLLQASWKPKIPEGSLNCAQMTCETLGKTFHTGSPVQNETASVSCPSAPLRVPA